MAKADTLENFNLLEDKGLRDSRPVIYASDHGELLGVGGLVGHNSSMRPELVDTPPSGNQAINNRVIPHVYINFTILGVIEQEEAFPTEEHDLMGNILSKPRPCSYNKAFPMPVTVLSAVYQYRSTWDTHGEHVDWSRSERLAALVGPILKSLKQAFIRRTLHYLIRIYWPNQTMFGTPWFSPRDALDELNRIEERRVERERQTLSDTTCDQLADLSYVQD